MSWRISRAAFTLGLAAMTVMIVREGAASIGGLIGQAGWPLLLLVPLHAMPLLLDVLGWRVLIFERTALPSLFLIASIREAVNRLLPVANVGGEVVGVRLLSRRAIRGTSATSSVIMEMLLNLVAQYLFFELGLVLLLRITGSVQAPGVLLIVFTAPLPLVALSMWLLRSGTLLRSMEKLGTRLLDPDGGRFDVLAKLAALDADIRRLAVAHRRLALAVGWQLTGMIAGSSETWLALRWLGHPVSPAAAVVLESLTLVARSVFFVVPGGLGVQEAGLIGVGRLLGVDSDVALALSLAKRMREILFGLPALALWYVGSRK